MSVPPARTGIRGTRFAPENLASMYAENAAAMATMTAAATSRKVSIQAVKNACKTHLKDLEGLDRWTNQQKTALSNNLNRAAKLLQLLLTKAMSTNANIGQKMNDELRMNLLTINTGSPAVAGFLAKEGWNLKDSEADRDLFRNMLIELQGRLAGGRRRSKKQKKQRRRTRRQK